jgi:Cu(I)/Ag(I) efflux system membrane protein CusA/SilA
MTKIGNEFMPPLDEGDLMYMPSTYPGISIGKARELLQQTDKLIRTVPEVATVFGKVGRAETATDPAPSKTEVNGVTVLPQSPSSRNWRLWSSFLA